MEQKSNLNELDLLSPDEIGNLLPFYVEWKQWFQPTIQRVLLIYKMLSSHVQDLSIRTYTPFQDLSDS